MRPDLFLADAGGTEQLGSSAANGGRQAYPISGGVQCRAMLVRRLNFELSESQLRPRVWRQERHGARNGQGKPEPGDAAKSGIVDRHYLTGCIENRASTGPALRKAVELDLRGSDLAED